MNDTLRHYEVRKPVSYCESGIVKDSLLLTEKQAEEVKAVLRNHPGLILVPVTPLTYRRLTGKYVVND